MRTIALVLVGMLIGAAQLPAEEEKPEIRLETPKGWGGERIALPPKFSPYMKLKGIEEIRFAPGMFDAESDSFFSYLFVFQLEAEPKLTNEVLQREILTYYRGLSVAVLKDKDVEVDPQSFTLKLESVEADENAKRPKGLVSYKGDLEWLEPFVTRKRQTLQLELDTWHDGESKLNYMFVVVSPKKESEPIWKEMREIRESFYKGQ